MEEKVGIMNNEVQVQLNRTLKEMETYYARMNDMQVSNTCSCGLVTVKNEEESLYELTVEGDLISYYNNERGEGAWEKLSENQQWQITTSVKRAVENYMEDRMIAFDIGIDTAFDAWSNTDNAD